MTTTPMAQGPVDREVGRLPVAWAIKERDHDEHTDPWAGIYCTPDAAREDADALEATSTDRFDVVPLYADGSPGEHERLRKIVEAAELACGLLWMIERRNDKALAAFHALRDALGGSGSKGLGAAIQRAIDAGHEADHPPGADWWAGKKLSKEEEAQRLGYKFAACLCCGNHDTPKCGTCKVSDDLPDDYEVN